MKCWSIVLAAVSLSLAGPVAAKPPITWVNGPVFTKSGPPPGRTVFLVQGPVDISELRDDFAKAFAGDTTAGQAYFTKALTECFSGARILGEAPHGIQRDERHRLGWRALPLAAPPDTATWSITWIDSAKTSVTFVGADSLSASLDRSGADWLIVVAGLVTTLESGEAGMAHFTPEGEWHMGAGTQPVETLEASVLVVGAHPATAVGHGRLSAWLTTGRFRKTSVDDIAQAFALELERALAKH